jgi:hypothetical protein
VQQLQKLAKDKASAKASSRQDGVTSTVRRRSRKPTTPTWAPEVASAAAVANDTQPELASSSSTRTPPSAEVDARLGAPRLSALCERLSLPALTLVVDYNVRTTCLLLVLLLALFADPV